LNAATSSHFLGKAYSPHGLFPPEMAYSGDILGEVIGAGYQWIILSGIACPTDWPVNKIYQMEHEGKKLAVFFRDDILSNKISFKDPAADFFAHLTQLGGNHSDSYIITAMDAQTTAII
jgi:alpha-amylase/alpha-mannosidase (GH57 family)